MSPQATQQVSEMLADIGRRSRAKRLPLGLIVEANGKEYSFASLESRDSFIIRATHQGLKPVIVRE